ncbi:hypothetical protein EON65_48245, partial [archaeon]
MKNDRYRIPKSRYDSVDLYISTDERNLPEYHDIDVPMDESVRKRLIDHGQFLATSRWYQLISRTGRQDLIPHSP